MSPRLKVNVPGHRSLTALRSLALVPPPGCLAPSQEWAGPISGRCGGPSVGSKHLFINSVHPLQSQHTRGLCVPPALAQPPRPGAPSSQPAQPTSRRLPTASAKEAPIQATCGAGTAARALANTGSTWHGRMQAAGQASGLLRARWLSAHSQQGRGHSLAPCFPCLGGWRAPDYISHRGPHHRASRDGSQGAAPLACMDPNLESPREAKGLMVDTWAP